jgi:hypothetical protein
VIVNYEGFLGWGDTSLVSDKNLYRNAEEENPVLLGESQPISHDNNFGNIYTPKLGILSSTLLFGGLTYLVAGQVGHGFGFSNLISPNEMLQQKAMFEALQQGRIPARNLDPAKMLDAIQTGLDGAGFYGPIGPFADGTNAVIDVLRGDYASAGINVAAMLPGLGDAIKVGHMVAGGVVWGIVVEWGDEAVNATKQAGNLEKLKSHNLKNINEHEFKQEVLNGTEGTSLYNISIDKKTKELFLTPVRKGALPNLPTGYWLGPNGPTTIKPK